MIVKDDGLSPQEHEEMRATVLAGTQEISKAGARRGRLAATGLAVVLIGGIAGGASWVYISGPGSPARSAATPSTQPEATTPQPCLDYMNSGNEIGDAGVTIAEAVQRAVLPQGFAISPGISVRDSSDKPGTLEAVVRVCSKSANRDDLIEVGNTLAAAIYSASDSDALTAIVIEPWVPISSDAIARDPEVGSISTQYQDYDWTVAHGDDIWE